jgi:hypothetical protein
MGIVHPYAYLRTYKHNVCKVVKTTTIRASQAYIREQYILHGKTHIEQ